VEFYSATKKNEILSFRSKWMELENIILSEVSQAQKIKNHVIPRVQIIDLKHMQNIIECESHINERPWHRRNRERKPKT
jgi:hypothetical protein